MDDSNRFAALSDEQLQGVHAAGETFEQALRNEKPIRIEDCIATVAEELLGPLFCELLAIELEWRTSRGAIPQVAEYRDRFPDRHTDIERVFQELRQTPPVADQSPVAGATPASGAGLAVGTVIGGRYTLVEMIGEGGMGSVYRASQAEPVKRQVALKVIKGGMDSKTVLARFDAERQALALMDHPNIARVFDGGSTPSGQPYFVMELVGGVPITQYCDDHRLTVPARLELFVSVCQAVQHAHLKGIIHRDLKPGNVLVTEVDGRPAPKVIDFGVAKATEQKLTDQSLAATAVIVGTPAYMSPEQADPSSMDIDTRTDVYALGVILFELLVGSPPHETKEFQRGAVLEMLRLVREVDSPRPSTKLSAAKALPTIAANRDIEPAKLTRLLKNDLDWIVLKALEKDRTRRYETANAFARDVQRHLADELVEARPPTAGYRLKKFVKRHRGQVIAASLVLIALLAGIVGTTSALYEAKRQELAARAETAEKEKARDDEARERGYAEAIANFVEQDFLALTSVEGRLDFDDKNTTLSKDSTLRELLDRAAQKLDARTDLNPRTEAKLRQMIGVNYRGLGEHQRAVPFLERCVALNLATFGQDDLRTLHAQDDLAVAYRAAGHLDKAVPLSEQALVRKKARLGPEHPETLNSMRILALAYRKTGQSAQALALLQQVLDASKARLGLEDPQTLTNMYNLALAYNAAGQPNKALPLLEQTLDLQKANLGLEHPDTNASLGMLAGFYRAAKQLNKAVPLYEQNIEWSKAKYGPDHPVTLHSMAGLAACYRDLGQLDKSIPLYEMVYALLEAKLGPQHPDTLSGMNELASAYWSAKKLDKSIPLFAEALKRKEAKFGRSHPSTLITIGNLGVNYRDVGRLAEALPLLEEAHRAASKHPVLRFVGTPLMNCYYRMGKTEQGAGLLAALLAEARTALPKDSPQLAGQLGSLGQSLLQAKAFGEAEPLLRECLTISETKEPNDWRTFNTKSTLGGTLLGQKKYADAEPLLLAGYAGMNQREMAIPASSKVRIPDALDRIIDLFTATNQPDDVKKWQAERAKYPLPQAPPALPAT